MLGSGKPPIDFLFFIFYFLKNNIMLHHIYLLQCGERHFSRLIVIGFFHAIVHLYKKCGTIFFFFFFLSLRLDMVNLHAS
jgi:hypothetical protein